MLCPRQNEVTGDGGGAGVDSGGAGAVVDVGAGTVLFGAIDRGGSGAMTQAPMTMPSRAMPSDWRTRGFMIGCSSRWVRSVGRLVGAAAPGELGDELGLVDLG